MAEKTNIKNGDIYFNYKIKKNRHPNVPSGLGENKAKEILKMAKPSFLFQCVRRNNDHETAIRSIFSITDLSQVILSVAYVRETGVLQLENLLKKHSSITTVFAGIRNGTTSAQGLLSLRACGVKLFVVDTGSISPIFHPKVYFAFSKKAGRVITGSANLTTYGLSFNIEASTVLTLDRADALDEYYLSDLLSGFSSLQNNFPEYVTEIKAKREIAQLLDEGRIEDERITTRLCGGPQKLDRYLR